VISLAVLALMVIGCDGKNSSVNPDNAVVAGGDNSNGVHDDDEGSGLQSGVSGIALAETRWKLNYVVYIWDTSYQVWDTVRYDDKNVVYDFRKDDRLIVSGKPDDSFVFDDFNGGEHFYEYSKSADCPLCTAVGFLTIDTPTGQNGRYIARLDDDTLVIIGDRTVGGEIATNGMISGGTYCRWAMTFYSVK
jgi:hypothetical protein